MNNLKNRNVFINEWKQRIENNKIILYPDDNDDINQMEEIIKDIIIDKDKKEFTTKLSGNIYKLKKSVNDDILSSNDYYETIKKQETIFPQSPNDGYIKLDNTKISKELLDKLFNTTGGKKDIGKGEVLLSGYYKNVYKTKKDGEEESINEYGDNYYIDSNGERCYIEVKSSNAEFEASLYENTKNIPIDFENTKIDLIQHISKKIEDKINNGKKNFKNHKKILKKAIYLLTIYLHSMKRNKKLCLVIFDNIVSNKGHITEKNATGYLQFFRKKNEIDTAESLLDIIDIGEETTKANHKKLFSISVEEKIVNNKYTTQEESVNNHFLVIHERKK